MEQFNASICDSDFVTLSMFSLAALLITLSVYLLVH